MYLAQRHGCVPTHKNVTLIGKRLHQPRDVSLGLELVDIWRSEQSHRGPLSGSVCHVRRPSGSGSAAASQTWGATPRWSRAERSERARAWRAWESAAKRPGPAENQPRRGSRHGRRRRTGGAVVTLGRFRWYPMCGLHRAAPTQDTKQWIV